MTQSKHTLRSQAARDRIVAAARQVFADVGYERATVRAIAEQASVVPAMLIRYFGSKEGVFAASVQVDLELPDLSAAEPGMLGPMLVSHFLARWEGTDHGGDLPALLRASADHQEARDRMIVIFSGQLAQAIGGRVDPALAAERAALVATQMLGLAFCRYVLRLPAVTCLEPAVLVDQIGSTIERYINGR